MKLFISNKAEFEEALPDSSDYHKKAYATLNKFLGEGFVPLQIPIGDEVFELKSMRGEIYTYAFIW